MNAPVHYDPASEAWSKPLDQFDMSDPALYQNDTWYPYFERLRREAPLHYCKDSPYGPYWSVSRYKDIMPCNYPLGSFIFYRSFHYTIRSSSLAYRRMLYG